MQRKTPISAVVIEESALALHKLPPRGRANQTEEASPDGTVENATTAETGVWWKKVAMCETTTEMIATWSVANVCRWRLTMSVRR